MPVSPRYRLQRGLYRARRWMPAWLRSALKRLSLDRAAIDGGVASGRSESKASGETTVVCFPIIDWEVRHQRPQQLLTRLAGRGYRVVYLRKDVAGWGMRQRAVLAPGVTGLALTDQRPEDIYGGAPSSSLVEAWVRAIAAEGPGTAPFRGVSLVQWPFWGPVAFAVRKRLGWPVIYDCMDHHGGFKGTAVEVVDLEDRLVRDSDLVLCSSRELFERHRGAARRCSLLPNAADYEHFAGPGARKRLRRLPSPVVGYFGALAEWFDADLLAHAAIKLPAWSFVLIGLNSGADLSAVEKLPNVHLLGERSYRDLPGYLHRFDVAVIPFVLSPLTRAANPVKLYEYLASGVPIVSVALPEVEPFRDLVYIASDPVEFVKLLQAAVAHSDPATRQRRRDVAQANTWEARVDSLGAFIQGAIELAQSQ